ncbi:MAG: hypothetical protein GF307_12780 [candidate division Zixibacteria bacterium]|nr:hypothetical protein [candidate division Zixibacteria bacterium]
MISRRKFIRQAGASTAMLLFAEEIFADPYRIFKPVLEPARAIRIRGRVHENGKGIGRVTVSDGLSVVQTEPNGKFELISNNRQQFVQFSLPSGYEIPANPTGTASFYKPIQAGRRGEMQTEFSLKRMPDSDQEHYFLAMADPQTQNDEEMRKLHEQTVPDVQKTAAGLSPASIFGVSLGDIMFDNLQYFPRYEQAVKLMGIPCYQVLGNHDCEVEARTDEMASRTFMNHFGPNYYSFNRGEIHYVVLDDIFWFGGYIGYVDQEQLEWLKSDLSAVEKGKTVVVFIHIPVYCERHVRYDQKNPSRGVVIVNRELLYKLLEPYKSTIICGHMHESEYLRDGGSDIHVCGAVCGAWWSGEICYDGTPKGYSIYKASGSDLSWQYKSTGKDISHQMRVYPPGSDPEHPDELIANVWSADPRWKILLYEDGQRKGEMRRALGTDPLSVKLHYGPELPERRKWVDPVNTDHLFYAKLSPGTKKAMVEAADPWGNVYSEELSI